MRKIIFCFSLFSLSAGCGDPSGFLSKASEVKIKSLLKAFLVNSQVYYIEREQFGSPEELYQWAATSGGNAPLAEIFSAWDRNPQVVPLQGYYFTMVEADAHGRPRQAKERVGLCAYPADKGSAAHVLCIVADQASAEEWNFYRAKFSAVGGPPREWPTERVYTKEKKYSPQEALQKVRQLSGREPSL